MPYCAGVALGQAQSFESFSEGVVVLSIHNSGVNVHHCCVQGWLKMMILAPTEKVSEVNYFDDQVDRDLTDQQGRPNVKFCCIFENDPIH